MHVPLCPLVLWPVMERNSSLEHVTMLLTAVVHFVFASALEVSVSFIHMRKLRYRKMEPLFRVM